jgi:hypothetical protein
MVTDLAGSEDGCRVAPLRRFAVDGGTAVDAPF